MSDLDVVVEKILDEDDDVEQKEEQDAMDGAESFAKNPTNKIPEPSLGEVIALLRETIKLNTTQNTGFGSKSKIDFTLSLTADSTSYRINSVNLVANPASHSTNSVNLVANPASHSTNSVKLVADPSKSCCSSNTVLNTLTADFTIPSDTNSNIRCANENSDEDYLNGISLEYENIARKGPPLNEKLTKIFQDLIWNNTKPEKTENLLKSVLPPEIIEGLKPNKVNIEIWRTISHQTKSVDLKLQNVQVLVQKSFAVIVNMTDNLYKNRAEKDEKDISQTIKDSIRKCTDAAVFWGEINQDILNLRRENIAPELNQNYKQLAFKTEDHPKLLFGDDLLKAIKDISETNKVGQSLTQRLPACAKTGNAYQNREAFFIQKPGIPPKRKAPAECSTISILPTKAAKVSIQQEHCYAKPLAPDFQIQVSELVHKMKFLNEISKAGEISEHINNWKGLTSDKWIMQTVKGVHIEIEDLDSVTLSGLSGKHC